MNVLLLRTLARDKLAAPLVQIELDLLFLALREIGPRAVELVLAFLGLHPRAMPRYGFKKIDRQERASVRLHGEAQTDPVIDRNRSDAEHTGGHLTRNKQTSLNTD